MNSTAIGGSSCAFSISSPKALARSTLASPCAQKICPRSGAICNSPSSVFRTANTGGASAYAEAAKFVARMATLRPKAKQVAYVLALKVRFARKRNFMKLLE